MDLYKNFELLKQGAEARLYLGQFLGRKVIVKERFSKKYRHPVLDEQLTKDRLRGEVRSLNRCKALGLRTPTIYLADLPSGHIVLECCEGSVTARDYIKGLMEGTDKGSETNTEKVKLHKKKSLLTIRRLFYGFRFLHVKLCYRLICFKVCTFLWKFFYARL